MKASASAVTVLAAFCLTACKPEVAAPPPADAPPESAVEAAPPAVAPPESPDGAPAAVPGAEAASADPAYAVLYPGAEASAPATRADSASSRGGMIQFTTTADPETVIAFYSQRAEAAGLKPSTSLSQGQTRGYRAASPDGVASVEVVAAPVEAQTAVQLSWHAPR